MWTIIYVGHDEHGTHRIKDKLEGEGFLVKLSESDDIFELLVPESEAEEAHDVIDHDF